ncbi:unnamed protein product [Urochloa humidicola]
MVMPAFMESGAEPPLAESYLDLLRRGGGGGIAAPPADGRVAAAVQERELPLIDLSCLMMATGGARESEAAACAEAMARAASEWGFFQVTGHGVGRALLERLRAEQARLFRLPFEAKAGAGLLNGSYRWGAPTATSLRHLSWSEAFHVPLASISGRTACDFGDLASLRVVMQEVAEAMSRVAKAVAVALAGRLLQLQGHPRHQEAAAAFPAGCDETTCFLRLNRYPACPFAADTFGLVPHTDSDFLTVLCQDQVGGLQLMKDARWVAVKPHPDALIVNIGDLFQARRGLSYLRRRYYVTCGLHDRVPSFLKTFLRFDSSSLTNIIKRAGVEQQPVQERGAQGGGQRQGGALLRRLLPLPVLRLARRQLRRAVAVQELHLRGVQEEGAGGRQEDRQKDWASQLPQTKPAPVTTTAREREHRLVF